MNIFVLSPDPVLAAHSHCDQHLHKMILESAQLLSTAAHYYFPSISQHLYKPSYEKHPCSIWTSTSRSNMAYVLFLATSLEKIRESQGCNPHGSIGVISAIKSVWSDWYQEPLPTTFAEAMFPHIKIRPDLNTVEKYQLYYRKKHQQWALDKGRGMTYKGRSVPDFMKDLIQ